MCEAMRLTPKTTTKTKEQITNNKKKQKKMDKEEKHRSLWNKNFFLEILLSCILKNLLSQS